MGVCGLLNALELIKEYCENFRCHSCMMYKAETGCFFKYHDVPYPHEWNIEKLDEIIYNYENTEDEPKGRCAVNGNICNSDHHCRVRNISAPDDKTEE